jgi:transposase
VLFPHLASTRLESVDLDGDVVVLAVSSTKPSAVCSGCGAVSARTHGGYRRRLADLPVGGRRVRLDVGVRRFRCGQHDCSVVTFVEQIPGLTARFSRRTQSLTEQLTRIGLALAGRAGARLAAALGMGCGRDTLLRLVRAHPDPPCGQTAVVGVDDFALRKRLRYATVVIDMTAGRPIDVLADRRVDSTAAWLRAHPGVRVVCRDGSAAYAEAIAQGAPRARQVSDRWHLWHGLSQAVLKEVATHSGCWAKTSLAPRKSRHAATTRERWRHVHDLLDHGVGLGECARRLNLSLNTVKRYARIAQPERLVRAPAYRPTLVDPYRDHLRQRRAADPAVAVTTLLAEIKALGYSGSANLLVRYINQGRVDGDRPPISPHGLTGLILTRREHLLDTQRQLRDELTTACPEMIDLADAVRGFAELLNARAGNEKRLQEWITTARAADLPYLHAFTRGLDKDAAAVAAGLSLPYSNGPTEGHVNRIKMIKRQMYGRASLDLLRKRVLLTT